MWVEALSPDLRRRTVLAIALVLALTACARGDAELGRGWLNQRNEGGTPCELVGQWQTGGIYATTITICREQSGVHRVHEAFGDENPLSQSTKQYSTVLIPVPEAPDMRFLRDEAFTDYYQLLEDGRLEVGNSERLLFVAVPVR